MLILKRRRDESIQVGDDIIVTITKFHGESQVSVGITAPDDMVIYRKELERRPDFDKERLRVRRTNS